MTLLSPVLASTTTPEPSFSFNLVDDVAQLFGIDAVDLAYQNIRAIEGLLLGQQLGNLILLELTAQFLDLSFQFFLAIQQLPDFLHSVVSAAANQIADLFELLFIASYEIQGPLTRKSLDASDTGCYTALEWKLENANFSRNVGCGCRRTALWRNPRS